MKPWVKRQEVDDAIEVLANAESDDVDRGGPEDPLAQLPFDLALGDNPFVAFADWWVAHGSNWETVAGMAAEAAKYARARAMSDD